MVPPCSGESSLAKQGQGKEQPGAWGDSTAMWGGVRLRLCQTQHFAMCLPGPGQPVPSRMGSPSSSATNLLTGLSWAEEGPRPHPGLAASWRRAGQRASGQLFAPALLLALCPYPRGK